MVSKRYWTQKEKKAEQNENDTLDLETSICWESIIIWVQEIGSIEWDCPWKLRIRISIGCDECTSLKVYQYAWGLNVGSMIVCKYGKKISISTDGDRLNPKSHCRS